MADTSKTVKSKSKSQSTGRFVPCPWSQFVHVPAAVQIMGPCKNGAYTAFCGLCGGRLYVPGRRWRPDLGLTVKQCIESKLLMLENPT